MTRGAILFAHNSPKYDYYSMAVATAKRINHFLGLPVTIVTDEDSVDLTSTYKFDKTIITVPDKNNKRDWGIWINKGRYQAYEFSPYDETLLLDVDYVVNSDKLNKTFDLSKDFSCHNRAEFFMNPNISQETLGPFSFDTLWATVIMFKKTKKSKQIFECLEMVQKNFNHYANIYGFISDTFRNDYALTLALRLINGHIIPKDNIIPWSLMHLGSNSNTKIYKNSDDKFNTEYTVMMDVVTRGKTRKEYMLIKDMDFHVIDKEYFMDII
jgi:hypothetical protein